MDVKVGGSPTWIQLELITTSGLEPIILTKELERVPEPRYVTFDLTEQISITVIHLQVKNADDEEPSHVHPREIELKELKTETR